MRRLLLALAALFALALPAAAQVPFATAPQAFIKRPSNTTTYTANTGWNDATSASTTVFTFLNACRIAGGSVLGPEFDFWLSDNQSTKLQGILWVFNVKPATVIQDNAAFTIAAADFANLTGNRQGFAFTTADDQSSGNNAAATLAGTTYQMNCAAGSTTLYGMVQVVNAYVPTSAEILNVQLNVLGNN